MEHALAVVMDVKVVVADVLVNVVHALENV